MLPPCAGKSARPERASPKHTLRDLSFWLAALALCLAALPLQAALTLRATDFIGLPVENPRGERLGEVARLVLDLRNDRIEYALVEFEASMRPGRELFAFRPEEFSWPTGVGKLVLPVTREQLEDARGFYDRRWPVWNEPPWHEDDDTPRSPIRVRVDQLLGETVYGADDGDVAGTLQDFIVELQTGRVRAAVLDVEDRGPISVPFGGIAVRRIGGALRVETTLDALTDSSPNPYRAAEASR